MSRTRGSSVTISSTIARVPSLLPSLTTITSKSSVHREIASTTERTVVAIATSSLCAGITTERLYFVHLLLSSASPCCFHAPTEVWLSNSFDKSGSYSVSEEHVSEQCNVHLIMLVTNMRVYRHTVTFYGTLLMRIQHETGFCKLIHHLGALYGCFVEHTDSAEHYQYAQQNNHTVLCDTRRPLPSSGIIVPHRYLKGELLSCLNNTTEPYKAFAIFCRMNNHIGALSRVPPL